ncbi:MAG: ABC transporter ATP-binding protein [Oscillospiraceae bacterium]
MIELKDLCSGYNGKDVIKDISLSFPPGKVLVLIGPNGCGKSTLLRTIIGLIPKASGEILVNGTPTDKLSTRELAQKAAYMAQSRSIPNITARRMVLHGRFPYLSYPRRYRKEDLDAAEEALRLSDASDVSDRFMTELSGGQRQKVYLAMALAQGTGTIFMDEPTTFLDVAHQLEVMRVARELASSGKAVVLVLHDLCLAMRYADIIAVMEHGCIRLSGTPEEVFLSGALDEVFDISLRRVSTPDGWQYYYVK